MFINNLAANLKKNSQIQIYHSQYLTLENSTLSSKKASETVSKCKLFERERRKSACINTHRQACIQRGVYTCMYPAWNASFKNGFLINFQNLKHMQTFQNNKQKLAIYQLYLVGKVYFREEIWAFMLMTILQSNNCKCGFTF